jgi:hypothetical protein
MINKYWKFDDSYQSGRREITLRPTASGDPAVKDRLALADRSARYTYRDTHDIHRGILRDFSHSWTSTGLTRNRICYEHVFNGFDNEELVNRPGPQRVRPQATYLR